MSCCPSCTNLPPKSFRTAAIQLYIITPQPSLGIRARHTTPDARALRTGLVRVVGGAATLLRARRQRSHLLGGRGKEVANGGQGGADEGDSGLDLRGDPKRRAVFVELGRDEHAHLVCEPCCCNI